jgi:hypothetical protein
MNEEEAKLSAPYGPFSTFETALNHLAALGGIPGKVDRTVFPSLGGVAKGHVITSLKFFGLIDDKGTPDSGLSELVLNKEKRKATLRALLVKHYPTITEKDLATMSLGQLDAKLADKQYNVSGGTKQKARSFLLKAAEYSGIPLSRLLTAKGARGPRKKRAPTAANGKLNTEGNGAEQNKGNQNPPPPPPLDPANVRMPIPLAPDRVAYLELPKDWNEKDAKKLLAVLKLSLDVPD